MGRNKDNTRTSTMMRDNQVHTLYEKIKEELGDLSHEVSRGYIYRRISEMTGLCTKCIAYILNHTKHSNV